MSTNPARSVRNPLNTKGVRKRPNQCVRLISVFALLLAGGLSAGAADIVMPRPSLENGFRLLYNLDFVSANKEFTSWEQVHPEDPQGPAGEAAGLLFSEFNRLGVLEAQFYIDDKAFAGRKKLGPDPNVRDRFNAALDRAEAEAKSRLARDPKDRDALFAMTLASGLRADYAALIEKRNLASLHYTKTADDWAGQLLAVDPNCYDAQLAIGINNYIVGSLAGPVRWILRLDGVAGDKQEGIRQLQLTADRGHYLAPFARIMLAIAYVREKNPAQAREILQSLRGEFPGNPLFGREIAELDARHTAR